MLFYLIYFDFDFFIIKYRNKDKLINLINLDKLSPINLSYKSIILFRIY